MKNFFFLGTEPYYNRPTMYWNRWCNKCFPTYCNRSGLNYVPVGGTSLASKAVKGTVFSPASQSAYRAEQLMKFSQMLHRGEVSDGDYVFLDDGQFPGIELILHAIDQLGIKLKISSYHHAGSWDHTDYTNRFGMGRWLMWEELDWFNIYDHIFVQSNYHREVIRRHFERLGSYLSSPLFNCYFLLDKVIVGNYPLGFTDWCKELDLRINVDECSFHQLFRAVVNEKFDHINRDFPILLFPHRMDVEKGYNDFIFLKDKIKKMGYNPVVPMERSEGGLDRSSYRTLVMESSVVLSMTQHEMFGVGVAEGFLFGNIPVVPNRLSYPELYGNYSKCFLYNYQEEMLEILFDVRSLILDKDYVMDMIEEVLSFNKKFDYEVVLENIFHQLVY